MNIPFEEHERRLRNLLFHLCGGDRSEPEDFYSPDPQTHSVAANLILATAEATEALVRNGADPKKLREDLFAVFDEYAIKTPFLRELLRNWIEFGDEDPARLDELRDYNQFVRTGKYKEEGNA